jgi:hypothetical protein
MTARIPIYLEVGSKRVFAGATDWPGWSRAGRTEDEAIAGLIAYGPRFRATVGEAASDLEPPGDAEDVEIVERVEGNATTDFGAPGVQPAADERPLRPADIEQLTRILESAWEAFDRAVATAEGHELRTGPRGGGRDAGKIVEHVAGAEGGYLTGLGRVVSIAPADRLQDASVRRAAILVNLAARAAGEVPPEGRRRTPLWTPRYFVRRTAWHALDHAWEIEDRTI